MKCQFCGAPLPAKGLICNYCGQRNSLNRTLISNVALETYTSSDNCPVCNVTMDEINIGDKKRITVQHCDSCDGIFLDKELLEKILQFKPLNPKQFDPHLLRFIKNHPRQERSRTIRYRKCPICHRLMERYNYKSVSGVVLDRCHRHGIWMDGGELYQLYEWKKAGGCIKTSPKPMKAVKTLYHFPKKEQEFDPIGDFLTKILGG